MKKMEKLHRRTLSSIYDILIRCCGASEYEQDRMEFVTVAESWDENRTFEWRFQGILGFGGKVWLYNSPWPYVNYYPADKNLARDKAVEAANKELAWLFRNCV